MNRKQNCHLCKGKVDFEGHTVMLALIHLEIEHFPHTEFAEDELFEKAHALLHSVGKRNIHINLAYALTQIVNLEEKMVVDSPVS
jgi:hypothetical protein